MHAAIPRPAGLGLSRQLPIVVGPSEIGNPAAGRRELAAWIREHRPHWRDGLLHRHGAILFRGFAGLATAGDFEEVATAVSPNLMDYVGGTSPRRPVKGRISSSTEAPPRAVIPQHQEMSYTSGYPDEVMFFCEVAPPSGGQTPLTDMRRVTAKLPAAVLDEFENRGLRLVRELARETRQVGRKTWPEVFGTSDRSEVERIAAEREWRVEWLGGGHLRLMQELRPATVTHPHTGDRVWFNQAHLYGRSLVRNVGRWLAGLVFPDRGKGDCVFGDGSAIPFASIRAIRDAVGAETTAFDWRAGDVLLIDNVLVAHGRRAYAGSRRVLAALIRDRT